MNKLFTSIAAVSLGLTMAIGVGTAVGTSVSKEAVRADAATSSYVITFKDCGGASDGTAKKTTISDLISSGSEYISSLGTTDNLYQAKSGYGIKGGGGSAKGMIVLNWNTADYSVKPTSIVAKIAIYNNSKDLNNGVLWGYNSSTSTAAKTGGATLTDYTINLDGNTSLTSITVAGKQASNSRFYLERLTINYESASAKTLSSIALSGTYPTSFYTGDTFSHSGMTVTATYDDTTTADVTSSATFSGYNMSTAGNQTVTVSYTEGGTTKTATYGITVNTDVLNSVTISSNMSTTSYTTAGAWETTGLTVTANYSGKGNVDVTNDASFNFYKDSAMTQEVATPNDLGIGNNQTIYVKATFSGVSNTTGYSQIVSVTKAPSVQTATINLADITTNDGHSQDATDVSITQGVVTFAWTKVSGSTAANNYIGGYNSRTQTRIYTGHRLTISANGNTLKCVNFVGATGSSNGPNKMNSWTGGELSDYDTSAGTATVTASNNVTSLVCQPTANTYLYSAEVQYYAADVPAESITINGESSSSISITPYQTTKLTASVLPLDATDRAFTWSLNPSGDDAIVTIDENGHVEPISGKYGPTVVTATSHDGGFTATCTVTVEHVSYHQAVYYPASTSSVTTSGTLPDGESHTFACGNYQSGYAQLTTNSPTASLTLSGYDGQKILAVLLKMHSNASAGSGSLSIVAGSTTVASIETAPFSDATWNGEYTTDWVLIEPSLTQYDVLTNEDIVITLNASVNSLYLSEIRVQYEASEVDNTAVAFAQLILDDITCDSSGKTAPSSQDWGVLVDLWNDGSTITASGKQTLLDAEAIEHQSPSTDQETIEAAMYKYDYIVGKYNKKLGLEDDYPDFILRNPAPIGKTISPIVTVNSSNIIPIIVIVSLISVSAIGGYFYIRRRKEHN